MKRSIFRLFDVGPLIWIAAAISAVTVLNAIAPAMAEAQATRAPTPAHRQPTAHELILDRLDDLPPAWSEILSAESRFKLVMGDAAVLDRETGLVWEKSPATSRTTWNLARDECTSRVVGNRKGWRLRSVHELASLWDPTQSEPALPPGHPFSNVQSSLSWSATTNANDTSSAWFVNFFDGGVSSSGGKATASSSGVCGVA
jgi:hypothetical protein